MSKLRKSARGQECQIRIPGICSGDPEETVLAHIGGHLAGAGMGCKAKSDMHGAFACHRCHAMVDGRLPTEMFTWDQLSLMHLEGVIRTQMIWLDMGLIDDAPK